MSTRVRIFLTCRPLRVATSSLFVGEGVGVHEAGELDLFVERIAAVDLGKAALVACVRVPHPSRPSRRMQEVRDFTTTTSGLLAMADWFRRCGVTRVVMESTSSYWKGAYYLLEAEGFTCWLVNAREVKNVPGRAKTDKADAVWLAKVAERGLCRPSLVHPPEVRRLRDLTRYRRSLIQDRTREQQRVEKLLEDAQIKLSSVISEVFGVSGRAMLEALIAGERDPGVLAALARGSMRAKNTVLREALRGFFTDHHARILRMMIDNVDRLSAQVVLLDTAIEEEINPFAATVAQLCEVTGIATRSAQELIAEIGVDIGRFPNAAHLVSWAKFCPQTHESAGRRTPVGRGKGNPWLAGTLGNIAAAIIRTRSFLAERYRRIARRRGKQKALVAVGHSVLTIVYHLMADPTARFHDLGPDYYTTRIDKTRQTRNLIHHLQALTGQHLHLHNGKITILDPTPT